MLKLYDAGMEDIGDPTNDPELQWAKLHLGFREGDLGPILRSSLRLVVPKRPDVTMLELQEAARTSAIAILEASLRVLRESTVDELEKQASQAQEIH